MIVYFCCAGGPTSMFFAKCAKSIFQNEDKIYVDNIRKVISLYKEGRLNNYELIFAQGTGFTATKSFFEENHFKEYVDMVYLLPQVAFNLPKFKENLDPYKIPCKALSVEECADVFKDLKKAKRVFKDLADRYNLKFKDDLSGVKVKFG